jgi:hypothetical protein
MSSCVIEKVPEYQFRPTVYLTNRQKASGIFLTFVRKKTEPQSSDCGKQCNLEIAALFSAIVFTLPNNFRNFYERIDLPMTGFPFGILSATEFCDHQLWSFEFRLNHFGDNLCSR